MERRNIGKSVFNGPGWKFEKSSEREGSARRHEIRAVEGKTRIGAARLNTFLFSRSPVLDAECKKVVDFLETYDLFKEKIEELRARRASERKALGIFSDKIRMLSRSDPRKLSARARAQINADGDSFRKTNAAVQDLGRQIEEMESKLKRGMDELLPQEKRWFDEITKNHLDAENIAEKLALLAEGKYAEAGRPSNSLAFLSKAISESGAESIRGAFEAMNPVQKNVFRLFYIAARRPRRNNEAARREAKKRLNRASQMHAQVSTAIKNLESRNIKADSPGVEAIIMTKFGEEGVVVYRKILGKK